MSDSAKPKILWISVGNVFACIAVVILHSNGIFWSFPSGKLWYTANFLETFCYWAVPVFFMISGTTLIDYREKYSTRIFLKKRFIRTFIPFVCWSIIGVFHYYITSHERIESIKDIIGNILNTKYIAIYWFFISLFSIYLMIPLFAAVQKELRCRVFTYLIFVGFVLGSVIPTISALTHFNYNVGFIPSVCSGYALYVMMGYVIKNENFEFPKRVIIYLLGILGWFIQFQGTTVMSFHAGMVDQTFKGYTNFPAVMQAAAVMVFIKYVPWEKILGQLGCKLIKQLSEYTFGVYLMHIYFVWHIPGLLGIERSSILFRTVGAVTIFFVCGFITFVISKIPLIKKSVGM